MQKYGSIIEKHVTSPFTEQECGIIRQQQSVEFRMLPLQTSPGRQSRVALLEMPFDNDSKLCTIVKIIGSDKRFDKTEIDFLTERMTPYSETLQRYGWRVPDIYYQRVEQTDDGLALFSYNQYIPGGDAELSYLSADNPFLKKYFILESIIRTLYNHAHNDVQRTVFRGGVELSMMQYGLDLKLANLVLDDQMHLWFIDLFGPKEIQDGKWVSYNRKMESIGPEDLMVVTATREGALLRCIRLSERAWSLSNHHFSPAEFYAEIDMMLQRSNAVEQEVRFIQDQISRGYPLLDAVYTESKV